MLSLPGVEYDETSNVVTASDEVWKTILKAHTFAFAYRTYGDSEWEELKTIFAPRVVEQKPGNEVIVLSSDDDKAAPPAPITSTVDFRGNGNTISMCLVFRIPNFLPMYLSEKNSPCFFWITLCAMRSDELLSFPTTKLPTRTSYAKTCMNVQSIF
ncbi:hypothetical protein ACP275_08G228700 [Erythranthe tilingii]